MKIVMGKKKKKEVMDDVESEVMDSSPSETPMEKLKKKVEEPEEVPEPPTESQVSLIEVASVSAQGQAQVLLFMSEKLESIDNSLKDLIALLKK